MFPILIIFFSPIFYGVKIDIKLEKKIFKAMLYGAIVSLISPFIFSLIYLPILENKGYFACKGTPLGYMPGMGTRYVLDLALCKER